MTLRSYALLSSGGVAIMVFSALVYNSVFTAWIFIALGIVNLYLTWLYQSFIKQGKNPSKEYLLAMAGATGLLAIGIVLLVHELFELVAQSTETMGNGWSISVFFFLPSFICASLASRVRAKDEAQPF